jgi:putative transposase
LIFDDVSAEWTVWRWIGPEAGGERPGRPGKTPYRLSDTYREAYAYFRGNVAALHRAHTAAVTGSASAAGIPMPDFLGTGWADTAPVSLRALQESVIRELTPAQRAPWSEGEDPR